MRKDIIIIDDDRDLCTLLQESLLQENICADISCNGFDGIKSVKDKEYQLVVLDVMMPGISGFEVLERIRDMSNVPILMLATVYKGNIIKNLIMDCQSYTKYRPNETTGGIFVSWRRKEELPTGA